MQPLSASSWRRLSSLALLLSTLAAAQTLDASKATYALGEPVVIRFAANTTELGSPYIALVPASARDDQDGSLHLRYLEVAPDGSVTFTGVKPGTYQARLYYASAVTGVIARAPFTVAGPQAVRPVTPPASPRPTPVAPPSPERVKPKLSVLLGGWQCLSRQQAVGERMLTLKLNPGGSWDDLTAGAARKQTSRYSYNTGTGVLRLTTVNGDKLADFEYVPAGSGSKERLVEVVAQAELYRAQVCYRTNR